ncbi:MOSC domain-containing protein [Actinobacillus vicugnae]|uniref:MOSC domain-containing protein n=1 Tax=Actinobacillus vicugnae TaxID=2573093 RepID=UPI001240FDDE|nr:MOSC N-terminal beta barrel domain-containing protein [Actinobacillus vicugnae]
MKVTQLNLYPIKSTQAYRVEQAFVEPKGLSFDREFMITETDGTFMTARKDAELYNLAVFPFATGIMICHTSGQKCVVLYQDFQRLQTSEVWGTHFNSWVAKTEVNQWLSEILGRAVQLRWLGVNSQREVVDSANHPLSFADSNPVSLMTEKSLEQVQQWSPVSISMARFRPNIVVDGHYAFEEEQWEQVQIGEVLFSKSALCTRCVMITRDLNTLELDPNLEPFRTLKQKHTNEKGKPVFGIHLVPQNSGIIRVGDQVLIKS